MAARIVCQKFSSRMSRSTSLLDPHLSASGARAGAPVTRTAPVQTARSPCTCPAAAETSWRTTGMPSIIMNRTTPTFVASGSKRGLSSTASNKQKPSEKAKMTAQQEEAEIKPLHDFTPSVWLNSLAQWMMLGVVYIMATDK